jgi:mitochondrial fission protein ELM1
VSDPPRVWVLLGHRKGDNNQLLALAEALGLPFETRTMSYKPLARLRMKLWRTSPGHLMASSRRRLRPPWPDLVIGIGRRTVPVARWIKAQNKGRTKLIRLGHPRADSSLFDLVITTRQYPVRPGENVITLPLAMNRFHEPPQPTAEEEAWLEAQPRPHLLLSVGGPAAMWRLDNQALGESAAKLARKARQSDGTLIVVGSPRTPPAAWQAVRESIGQSDNIAFAGDSVRYPILLHDADEQYVTADSISMISEAVMTGKPVGLIPVEPDARGRRRLGPNPELTKVRDPRRFWADVEAQALAGTVDEPKSRPVEDPVDTAVAAVKRTLGGLFE